MSTAGSSGGASSSMGRGYIGYGGARADRLVGAGGMITGYGGNGGGAGRGRGRGGYGSAGGSDYSDRPVGTPGGPIMPGTTFDGKQMRKALKVRTGRPWRAPPLPHHPTLCSARRWTLCRP